MKLIFLSIIFHVLASIFLKFGSLSLGGYNVLEIVTNPYYIISLFFLFLQAIVWQFTLKRYNLNFAYSFTSLYYPLILLSSFFIFNENITIGNVIGTFIIVVGLILSLKNKKQYD